MNGIELVVGGIALLPIIVALVEGLKRIGLPTKYAPLANAVLSVLGYGIMVVLGLDIAQGLVVAGMPLPEFVGHVLTALIVFLGAAGLYDRTQNILPYKKS